MTIKDLLDYIKKYEISEETILDGISHFSCLPSYYDGYCREIKTIRWSIKTKQNLDFILMM